MTEGAIDAKFKENVEKSFAATFQKTQNLAKYHEAVLTVGRFGTKIKNKRIFKDVKVKNAYQGRNDIFQKDLTKPATRF